MIIYYLYFVPLILKNIKNIISNSLLIYFQLIRENMKKLLVQQYYCNVIICNNIIAITFVVFFVENNLVLNSH